MKRYEIVIKDVERIPDIKVKFSICEVGSDDVREECINLAYNIEDGDIMGEVKKYAEANIEELCKQSVIGLTDFIEVGDK